MGRTMDVQYFSSNAEGCFASEERKMPCCEDTLEILSVEDEHQNNHFEKLFDAGFVFLPELLPLEYNSLIGLPNEEAFSFYPDPPDLQEEPIFIRIQSLTYYG